MGEMSFTDECSCGSGFPSEIILPLTMVSRCPGVMAHWREAMGQPARLWRPQQVYTGELGKDL